MAEGVSDAEFEAEAQAWVESRGEMPAARELLELAAEGHPGERMLAVAVVTAIGAPAAPALRESLAVEPLRGYAKVALLSLSGIDDISGAADVPPELDLNPDDLAWIATDLLALACDDEYPDPDDLAVSFREAVPVARKGRCSTRWPAAPTPTPRTCSTTSAATTRTSRSQRRPERPRTKPPPASGAPGTLSAGRRGNASLGQLNGEGRADVRGHWERERERHSKRHRQPRRDQPHRGPDAGKPLVRPHARLPLPGQRQRLPVRPAVRRPDRRRANPDGRAARSPSSRSPRLPRTPTSCPAPIPAKATRRPTASCSEAPPPPRPGPRPR